jgi:regulator of protease activity HflC (stomatin/prohibitin superfamily)
MSIKSGITLGIVAVVGLIIVGVLFSTIEVNYAQNWQIYQHVGGKVDVIDEPGWYLKLFGKVWTYPRYMEAQYNDDPDVGRKAKESVRATFNDGGTADISTYVKFATPTTEEERKEFHRQFSGNIENARTSVKAHLNQCIKAASPLMSSSENQSARKAEYAQICESMLRDGLYKMRKVEKELKDRYDEQGKPVTVWATEILLDESGVPQIERESPLSGYGIGIMQFSVTATDYDGETRKQFAAKKEAFLYAEQAKAERERQVQERLKTIEQKLAEKAEIEGEAEKEKAKQTIEAEMRVAVEQQQKLEEETRANKLLEVAKIEKMEAETRANKDLEVAKIQANAALERKKAVIAEAEAKQKAIELSGEITNLEAYIIDAEVSKAEKVAQAIAKINVPRVMISGAGGIGGEGGAGGMNMMENILALLLLDKGDFINLTGSGVEVSQERLAHIKNPANN